MMNSDKRKLALNATQFFQAFHGNLHIVTELFERGLSDYEAQALEAIMTKLHAATKVRTKQGNKLIELEAKLAAALAK